MKKITLLIVVLAMFTSLQPSQAQAPKYAMFEHFTQASCGPCAQQNPGFQSSILDPNPSTVRHIAYHTSWPGYDPMYNLNPNQSDERVTYYNVGGVPEVHLLGNVKVSSPGGFVQQDVDDQVAATSPIKITVLDVDNGTSHDVTITVYSVGTPPAGNLKIRTAIVERNVNYTSPPGNNGEKYFPNVFREMLPSTAGDVIVLAAQGGSVVFNYTYDENAAWNMDEIALIAFVQNESTKEIYNCGASFDPSAAIADPVALTSSGTVGSVATFTLDATNNSTALQDYSYTLTATAPLDWSGEFVANGTTYSSTATVTMAAGAVVPVTINVTPGATAAMGIYTLSIQSLTSPNEDPVVKSVYVFSGVTELVVNNAAMAPATATFLQTSYTTAFASAGSTSYAFLNSSLAQRASQESSLTGVKNMYYNVGWYFPAFTDDFVTELMAFMDNGGNLFISGQDIGWDVWTDPADLGHATPLSQQFFNDYMFADFIDDGSTANKPLTANTADPVFGALGSTLINYYYTSTYFFPDQIVPYGIGTPIFYYNNNTAKTAGVRGDNGTYKTVYIAPGIEMLGTPTNKTAIIKTAYDWFYGVTGTGNIVAANEQMGQNFPNPGNEITYIPVSGLTEDMTLTVMDQLGRTLISQQVPKNASTVTVNITSLSNGVYFYRLANASNQGITKSMEVAR
ncbi:MAG: Omp28-related outer membrane protein [Chitinophagaceae bacterium]|nr:Omp28-related outer membrane protein [Chitinophagaceae bacterium]